MDKGIFHEMMKLHAINQVSFMTLDFSLLSEKELSEKLSFIQQNFSLPLYVKPANSGSSIGITKVEAYEQVSQAIEQAKLYDHKVLIEEGFLSPKEIEIAIIGNTTLTVSEP
jgi:D-alanine-D-alanine ligase